MPEEHRVSWPDNERFLADYLNDDDFFTALSTSNGFLSKKFGNANGYDAFSGRAADVAQTVFDGGVASLEQGLDDGADRWFLHLHFLEPHVPYDPPEDYLDALEGLEPVPWDLSNKAAHYEAVGAWESLSEDQADNLLAHLAVRYEGEIRWLDDQLEGFFADMEQRGWLEDTLVAVWSDHGEQFYERGHASHGWNLHQEENTGLFFMASEGLVPGASTAPSTSIDIVPTLMQGLGLAAPVADVDGLALGLGTGDRPRFALADAKAGLVQMVERDNKQLFYNWNGSARLYNLAVDPQQQDDLFDPTHPDVQALWPLLVERTERLQPLAPQYTAVAPPGLSLTR